MAKGSGSSTGQPPDAPVLTAQPGDRQVTLEWNVPYDGGQELRTYIIMGLIDGELEDIAFFSASATSATIVCSADLTCNTTPTITRGSVDTVTATITNLEVNTEYSFAVFAKNTLNGHRSNVVTVSTFDVPGKPQNLVGSYNHDTKKISLSWDPPDDGGGSPVTKYVVFQKIGNATSFSEWSSITQTNLTFALWPWPQVGVPYEYGVYAFNAIGRSGFSDTVVVMHTTKPGPVRNLTAAPGDNSVTLSWDPPDTGGTPTRYSVEASVDSTAPHEWFNTLDYGIQSTSYTATGLTGGIPYNFRVSAINSLGGSDFVKIDDVLPRGIPFVHKLAGEVTGATSVSLSWEPDTSMTCRVADGLPNLSAASRTVCFEEGQQSWWLETPVTEYVISYRIGNVNPFVEYMTVSSPTSVATIDDLMEGMTYQFVVSGSNNVGVGHSSNLVTLTTN